MPENRQAEAEKQEVEDFAASAAAKVQLDVEDAPFLQEEVPSAPPVPVQENKPGLTEEALPEETAQADTGKKKKRLIVLGALAFCVIITGVLGWFFLLKPVPPAVAPPQNPPTVIVVPSPEKITGPAEFQVQFDPFWIAQKADNGATRFLQVRFSSVTLSDKVVKEAADKMLVLRDAVYYYLRNKTHEFLLDPENVPVIKQDILGIINGYVVQGRMEDVLIENYLVK